jgi:L,D-peptidoglycan transpeptidase YkuD (ErfK/YbiS/YcfS/YnhG family)
MNICVNSSAMLTWTDILGATHTVSCALGCGGIAIKQSEGDGITPVGNFALLSVMVRDDRLALPETALSISTINKNDGWCDDPAAPDYNSPVTLPHSANHEKLYRDDALYDVIVDVDYNRTETISGKGSAIFIHVAQPTYSPTKGCIALALKDLLELLKSCDGDTRLIISP